MRVAARPSESSRFCHDLRVEQRLGFAIGTENSLLLSNEPFEDNALSSPRSGSLLPYQPNSTYRSCRWNPSLPAVNWTGRNSGCQRPQLCINLEGVA